MPVRAYPSFDFHIHPSGTPAASEADKHHYASLPWRTHIIFDTEGHGMKVP